MLESDVIVLQAIRFLYSPFEDLLDVIAERSLERRIEAPHHFTRMRGNRLTEPDRRDASGLEQMSDEWFVLPKYAQQHVLGLDRHAAEQTGLVTGKEERAACALGKSLKHDAVHDMTEGAVPACGFG